MNEKSLSPSPLTPLSAPVAILGVPFDPVTTDQTVAAIVGMVASRRPHYAVTPNVDFVVQALDDIELRKILFDAHLVLCDGMPLVWASRFLGNPLPERVAGSDLVPRLLAESETRGWRVFFFGGRQESLDNAAARTLEKYPRLRLVGAYSPPLRPLTKFDDTEILERIHRVKPDLLFVALGCPKQEKWINMHYRNLGVPICIGVGASLSFIGGTLRRAPVWMQRTGTEWLFRLIQEPGRLGGRYANGIWVFSRAIVRQWWLLRSRRRHTRPSPVPLTPPALGSPPGPAAPLPTGQAPPHTVLTAPERLDAVAVATLAESWVAAMDSSDVAIDLETTRFIDSTGVGLLIRLRKRADLRQTRLILCRSNPPVEKTLRLMRIEDFFDRSETLASRETFAGVKPAGSFAAKTSAGARLSLVWNGEVTAVTRMEMANHAETQIAALPPGAEVDIDLSRVTFADSSGLGFMLSLKKRSWGREVSLRYRHPSPAVRNVMRITSLEAYLLEEMLP